MLCLERKCLRRYKGGGDGGRRKVLVPVETPDEEDDEAVGDGGGGVGGGVEFQEDADEDPEGCHYCEAGEEGLAAAEMVDGVEGGERHDRTLFPCQDQAFSAGFDGVLPKVVLPAFKRI